MQPDLFSDATATPPAPRSPDQPRDTHSLIDLLSATCERPHYNLMLLTLIAEASRATGSAGPFVRVDGETITIRDWLCDAMSPAGRREARRRAMVAKVREEFAAAGTLPTNDQAAEAVVDVEARLRLRQSGRTNVSRAVSELVRAGVLSRYYKGDYVDHENRGGQRHAVYTVSAAARRALALSG